MSNLEPELDQLERFFEKLHPESDRGAALTAGAMLEDRLGDILGGFLIEEKEAKQLLVGFNAPLGTLSARLLACYSLGLVEKNEFTEMEIIRKVRNQFAHNWEGVSFESQSIKDLVATLPWRGPDEYEENTTSKDRFVTAVSMLMVDLLWRTRLVKQKRLEVKPWPHKTR